MRRDNKNVQKAEVKEDSFAATTLWAGIKEVIDDRRSKFEKLTITVPKHPRPYGKGKKANLHTMMMAAANGEYDGDRPVVDSFNQNMKEKTGKNDIFTDIVSWIGDQEEKISHAEIFSRILDIHNGDVGYAIRDTMLFFHALTRDSRLLNEADLGNDLELRKREKLLLEHVLPINVSSPLPKEYFKWPSRNLRNRVGEYYHQYWIVYLSMYYPKRIVQTLVSGEYAIFGILQGNVKRKLDFNLLKNIPILRLTLAGIHHGFTVVPFSFKSSSQIV